MSFKFDKNPFGRTKKIVNQLYLENISGYIEKYNHDNFSNLHHINLKKDYIMSDEGFMLVENNVVKQIIYKDGPISKITLTDNEIEHQCYIDESKEIIGNQVFQIPYCHTEVSRNIEIYGVSQKSAVKLHIVKQIENNKEVIVDMYFVLNDDIKHQYILDDIFTLLSRFN